MNSPTPPQPSYSRCPGCDKLIMHCVCGEEPITDSWRPVVAGVNQWPLVLIAGFLLTGCTVTPHGQAWIDSLIDGAAHWMDRVPLWAVVLTALWVATLTSWVLGWAIAKPHGPRGMDLNLDCPDVVWDESGPQGYHEHLPSVGWDGNLRARPLFPIEPVDDELVSYMGSEGEAVMIPRSLAIKLAGLPSHRNSPHRHGHEF